MKRLKIALVFAFIAASLCSGCVWAAATQLSVAAGDNQSAPAGSAVAGVVCVIARDAGNNPVSGVSVTWGNITGGGSLTGATKITGGDGIATLGSWTLGPAAGINTITATSAGLPDVTFT